MTIKYHCAPDVEQLAKGIVVRLGMEYVNLNRFACVRSSGSKSFRTVARLHSIPTLWKEALQIEPCYAIEVISEKFDRMDKEDKEKTIIHELLHIPKGFGGGFRHHGDYVTDSRVSRLHALLGRKSLNTNGTIE